MLAMLLSFLATFAAAALKDWLEIRVADSNAKSVGRLEEQNSALLNKVEAVKETKATAEEVDKKTFDEKVDEL